MSGTRQKWNIVDQSGGPVGTAESDWISPGADGLGERYLDVNIHIKSQSSLDLDLHLILPKGELRKWSGDGESSEELVNQILAVFKAFQLKTQ